MNQLTVLTFGSLILLLFQAIISVDAGCNGASDAGDNKDGYFCVFGPGSLYSTDSIRTTGRPENVVYFNTTSNQYAFEQRATPFYLGPNKGFSYYDLRPNADDPCNCFGQDILWRAQVLQGDSQQSQTFSQFLNDRPEYAGRSVAFNISEYGTPCSFINLGYTWRVSDYNTDPIVLTIPPGGLVDVGLIGQPLPQALGTGSSTCKRQDATAFVPQCPGINSQPDAIGWPTLLSQFPDLLSNESLSKYLCQYGPNLGEEPVYPNNYCLGVDLDKNVDIGTFDTCGVASYSYSSVFRGGQAFSTPDAFSYSILGTETTYSSTFNFDYTAGNPFVTRDGQFDSGAFKAFVVKAGGSLVNVSEVPDAVVNINTSTSSPETSCYFNLGGVPGFNSSVYWKTHGVYFVPGICDVIPVDWAFNCTQRSGYDYVRGLFNVGRTRFQGSSEIQTAYQGFDVMKTQPQPRTDTASFSHLESDDLGVTFNAGPVLEPPAPCGEIIFDPTLASFQGSVQIMKPAAMPISQYCSVSDGGAGIVKSIERFSDRPVDQIVFETPAIQELCIQSHNASREGRDNLLPGECPVLWPYCIKPDPGLEYGLCVYLERASDVTSVPACTLSEACAIPKTTCHTLSDVFEGSDAGICIEYGQVSPSQRVLNREMRQLLGDHTGSTQYCTLSYSADIAREGPQNSLYAFMCPEEVQLCVPLPGLQSGGRIGICSQEMPRGSDGTVLCEHDTIETVSIPPKYTTDFNFQCGGSYDEITPCCAYDAYVNMSGPITIRHECLSFCILAAPPTKRSCIDFSGYPSCYNNDTESSYNITFSRYATVSNPDPINWNGWNTFVPSNDDQIEDSYGFHYDDKQRACSRLDDLRYRVNTGTFQKDVGQATLTLPAFSFEYRSFLHNTCPPDYPLCVKTPGYTHGGCFKTSDASLNDILFNDYIGCRSDDDCVIGMECQGLMPPLIVEGFCFNPNNVTVDTTPEDPVLEEHLEYSATHRSYFYNLMRYLVPIDFVCQCRGGAMRAMMQYFYVPDFYTSGTEFDFSSDDVTMVRRVAGWYLEDVPYSEYKSISSENGGRLPTDFYTRNNNRINTCPLKWQHYWACGLLGSLARGDTSFPVPVSEDLFNENHCNCVYESSTKQYLLTINGAVSGYSVDNEDDLYIFRGAVNQECMRYVYFPGGDSYPYMTLDETSKDTISYTKEDYSNPLFYLPPDWKDAATSNGLFRTDDDFRCSARDFSTQSTNGYTPSVQKITTTNVTLLKSHRLKAKFAYYFQAVYYDRYTDKYIANCSDYLLSKKMGGEMFVSDTCGYSGYKPPVAEQWYFPIISSVEVRIRCGVFHTKQCSFWPGVTSVEQGISEQTDISENDEPFACTSLGKKCCTETEDANNYCASYCLPTQRAYYINWKGDTFLSLYGGVEKAFEPYNPHIASFSFSSNFKVKMDCIDLYQHDGCFQESETQRFSFTLHFNGTANKIPLSDTVTCEPMTTAYSVLEFSFDEFGDTGSLMNIGYHLNVSVPPSFGKQPEGVTAIYASKSVPTFAEGVSDQVDYTSGLFDMPYNITSVWPPGSESAAENVSGTAHLNENNLLHAFSPLGWPSTMFGSVYPMQDGQRNVFRGTDLLNSDTNFSFSFYERENHTDPFLREDRISYSTASNIYGQYPEGLVPEKKIPPSLQNGATNVIQKALVPPTLLQAFIDFYYSGVNPCFFWKQLWSGRKSAVFSLIPSTLLSSCFDVSDIFPIDAKAVSSSDSSTGDVVRNMMGTASEFSQDLVSVHTNGATLVTLMNELFFNHKSPMTKNATSFLLNINQTNAFAPVGSGSDGLFLKYPQFMTEGLDRIGGGAIGGYFTHTPVFESVVDVVFSRAYDAIPGNFIGTRMCYVSYLGTVTDLLSRTPTSVGFGDWCYVRMRVTYNHGSAQFFQNTTQIMGFLNPVNTLFENADKPMCIESIKDNIRTVDCMCKPYAYGPPCNIPVTRFGCANVTTPQLFDNVSGNCSHGYMYPYDVFPNHEDAYGQMLPNISMDTQLPHGQQFSAYDSLHCSVVKYPGGFEPAPGAFTDPLNKSSSGSFSYRIQKAEKPLFNDPRNASDGQCTAQNKHLPLGLTQAQLESWCGCETNVALCGQSRDQLRYNLCHWDYNTDKCVLRKQEVQLEPSFYNPANGTENRTTPLCSTWNPYLDSPARCQRTNGFTGCVLVASRFVTPASNLRIPNSLDRLVASQQVTSKAAMYGFEISELFIQAYVSSTHPGFGVNQSQIGQRIAYAFNPERESYTAIEPVPTTCRCDFVNVNGTLALGRGISNQEWPGHTDYPDYAPLSFTKIAQGENIFKVELQSMSWKIAVPQISEEPDYSAAMIRCRCNTSEDSVYSFSEEPVTFANFPDVAQSQKVQQTNHMLDSTLGAIERHALTCVPLVERVVVSQSTWTEQVRRAQIYRTSPVDCAALSQQLDATEFNRYTTRCVGKYKDTDMINGFPFSEQYTQDNAFWLYTGSDTPDLETDNHLNVVSNMNTFSSWSTILRYVGYEAFLFDVNSLLPVTSLMPDPERAITDADIEMEYGVSYDLSAFNQNVSLCEQIGTCQASDFRVPNCRGSAGFDVTGCSIAMDKTKLIPCELVGVKKWRTCQNPVMQLFYPEFNSETPTVPTGRFPYPVDAFRSYPAINKKTVPYSVGYELLFSSWEAEEWSEFITFNHYCSAYGTDGSSDPVYCANDFYDRQTRIDLCENKNASNVFAGYQVTALTLKDLCPWTVPGIGLGFDKNCFVIPGTPGFKSITDFMRNPLPEGLSWDGTTFYLVPFSYTFLSNTMIAASFAYTKISNSFAPENLRFIDALNVANLGENALKMAYHVVVDPKNKTQNDFDRINAFINVCQRDTALTLDHINTIYNVAMDTYNPVTDRYEFVRLTNDVSTLDSMLSLTMDEMFPPHSFVGSVLNFDGITVTSALTSRRAVFKADQTPQSECTAFNIDGKGISVTNIEFDMTGCGPQKGISVIPVVFSGAMAQNGRISNISIQNGLAAVAVVGSFTNSFEYTPVIDASGLVIRNIDFNYTSAYHVNTHNKVSSLQQRVIAAVAKATGVVSMFDCVYKDDTDFLDNCVYLSGRPEMPKQPNSGNLCTVSGCFGDTLSFKNINGSLSCLYDILSYEGDHSEDYGQQSWMFNYSETAVYYNDCLSSSQGLPVTNILGVGHRCELLVLASDGNHVTVYNSLGEALLYNTETLPVWFGPENSGFTEIGSKVRLSVQSVLLDHYIQTIPSDAARLLDAKSMLSTQNQCLDVDPTTHRVFINDCSRSLFWYIDTIDFRVHVFGKPYECITVVNQTDVYMMPCKTCHIGSQKHLDCSLGPGITPDTLNQMFFNEDIYLHDNDTVTSSVCERDDQTFGVLKNAVCVCQHSHLFGPNCEYSQLGDQNAGCIGAERLNATTEKSIDECLETCSKPCSDGDCCWYARYLTDETIDNCVMYRSCQETLQSHDKGQLFRNIARQKQYRLESSATGNIFVVNDTDVSGTISSNTSVGSWGLVLTDVAQCITENKDTGRLYKAPCSSCTLKAGFSTHVPTDACMFAEGFQRLVCTPSPGRSVSGGLNGVGWGWYDANPCDVYPLNEERTYAVVGTTTGYGGFIKCTGGRLKVMERGFGYFMGEKLQLSDENTFEPVGLLTSDGEQSPNLLYAVVQEAVVQPYNSDEFNVALSGVSVFNISFYTNLFGEPLERIIFSPAPRHQASYIIINVLLAVFNIALISIFIGLIVYTEQTKEIIQSAVLEGDEK